MVWVWTSVCIADPRSATTGTHYWSASGLNVWPPILLSIYIVPSGHLMRKHNIIFHSYEDGVYMPQGVCTQITVLHMCFCDCTYFSWVYNHITTLRTQILSSLNYWCTCRHAHWEIVSVCAVCSWQRRKDAPIVTVRRTLGSIGNRKFSKPSEAAERSLVSHLRPWLINHDSCMCTPCGLPR